MRESAETADVLVSIHDDSLQLANNLLCMDLQFLRNLWKAQLGGHRNYYHYPFAETFSAILDVLVSEELLALLA